MHKSTATMLLKLRATAKEIAAAKVYQKHKSHERAQAIVGQAFEDASMVGGEESSLFVVKCVQASIASYILKCDEASLATEHAQALLREAVREEETIKIWIAAQEKEQRRKLDLHVLSMQDELACLRLSDDKRRSEDARSEQTRKPQAEWSADARKSTFNSVFISASRLGGRSS